jgi:hypothetical protein
MLVNAEDLFVALEAGDGEIEWCLDLSNGDVVPVVGDADPDLAEAVENQPERFVHIEPIGSHEAFRIREAFVAALPEGEPASELASALAQRRPFRRFKDALCDWPDVREQWFRFHDARLREIAQAWLAEREVEAELSERPAPPPEA